MAPAVPYCSARAWEPRQARADPWHPHAGHDGWIPRWRNNRKLVILRDRAHGSSCEGRRLDVYEMPWEGNLSLMTPPELEGGSPGSNDRSNVCTRSQVTWCQNEVFWGGLREIQSGEKTTSSIGENILCSVWHRVVFTPGSLYQAKCDGFMHEAVFQRLLWVKYTFVKFKMSTFSDCLFFNVLWILWLPLFLSSSAFELL